MAEPMPPHPGLPPTASEEELATFLERVARFVPRDVVSLKLMCDWPWSHFAQKMIKRSYVPNFLTVHSLCVNLLNGTQEDHHRELNEDVKSKNITKRRVRKEIKDMDPELESSLRLIWPDLNNSKGTRSFWAYEYVKHGRLSGLCAEDYFRTAFMFHQKLSYGLNLTVNKMITVDELLRQLRGKLYGKTPRLKVLQSIDVPTITVSQPCHLLLGVDLYMSNTFEITNYAGTHLPYKDADSMYIPHVIPLPWARV